MKSIGLGLAAVVMVAVAAGAPAVRGAGDAPTAWVNISDPVIADLAKQDLKPGYAGPTSGVVADRTTGDVYMVVNDLGLWKSTDRGRSFARVADGKTVGGRCETAFALAADPGGKRLMCFMIYGPSAMTPDAGKTWVPSKTSHLDYGAVDWTDGRAMIALRHESGGTACLTADGGATWKDLGKGFKGVGLFDAATLVALMEKEPGIFRSTDGGANWTKVSESKPTGFAMQVLKGVGYWTSAEGLLVSRDKGATWSVLGSPVRAMQGPLFGKDERHLVVVGKEGFQETRDGGKTWRLAAPLPEGYNADFMTLCAWDPVGDVFYISRMTKPTMKFERAAAGKP